VKIYLGRRPGAAGGVIPNSVYPCRRMKKKKIKIKMHILGSPLPVFQVMNGRDH